MSIWYLVVAVYTVTFGLGAIAGWVTRDWFKTRPPLPVRDQIRAAEHRVAKNAQAYWSKHIHRLINAQNLRLAEQLDRLHDETMRADYLEARLKELQDEFSKKFTKALDMGHIEAAKLAFYQQFQEKQLGEIADAVIEHLRAQAGVDVFLEARPKYAPSPEEIIRESKARW